MTAADAIEHETRGDPRVRQLIDRYVALSGASLTELGPQLYELTVAAADRAAFRDRSTVRLAFSVEAVQTDANAEMAIMGGMFVERSSESRLIRSRHERISTGRISGPVPPGTPRRLYWNRCDGE